MQTITRYFNNLSENQIASFGKLKDVYSFWNQRINVISRKDIDSIYTHHVLHSLSIAKFIQFESGTRIIDVGTGGGFPAIPLAIMFPDVEYTAIDSIGKKITVVQEVSKEIGLSNIIPKKIRSNELKDKFDFIISRAVSAFPKFLADTQHLIKPKGKNSIKNGIIYLKGGDLSQELEGFENKVQLTPISTWFDTPFFAEKKILYFPISGT